MNLKKQQIKRIDDFLIRLEFEYIDIRYEMVDHIATDIETNFNDLNTFFEKNKFRGPFLIYMLSRKKELEKSYRKQVKSKSWIESWFIIKEVGKKILLPKNLLLTLLSIFTIKYFWLINPKYVLYIMASLLFSILIFETYYFRKETKKIGKLKILNSYYALVITISYFAFQIPNFVITVVQQKTYNDNYPFFLLCYIIILLLIFQVFHDQKEKINTKYKYLLIN